jgi:hypothetical protein
MKTWAALLLVGCTASDGDSGTEAGGDEALPTQAPAGNRVLVYYGHGGASGDGSGRGAITAFEALVEDELGYPLDWRDYLPDDLSDYRAILLMGSGMEGEQSYSAAEAEQLRLALDLGARLVVLAEVETCGLSVANDLLATLELTMALSGDGADSNHVVTGVIADPDSQILAGVADVSLRDPCYVDLGGASALIKDDDRHGLMAVERPPARAGAQALPGDVVLVGDFQFLDDGGGLDNGDHMRLATNLVEVAP